MERQLPTKGQVPILGKRRRMKWMITSFLILGLIYFLIFLIKGPVREEKPYFADNKPLVIAHQGGELLAPSNTMAAFKKAYSLHVDVLEFDIHMTKDGKLVVIHDNTVDRTTNGKGRVDHYTLSSLQKLDAGYKFKDLNGEYSYRDKGVYIPTVEEVFQSFPDIRMNIEIKDTYPKGSESQIERKLWELIKKYHMENKVLIVAFSQDIVDRFDHFAKGEVAIAGGKEEITKFVVLQKLLLNGLYQSKVDAIQIPTEESIFNLADKSLINHAHELNMKVDYWTIDSEKEMRKLLDLGADGIMTNRPDILMKVMKDYHK